jgi:hypothetical protein
VVGPQQFQPRLEALEDRAVPAAFAFDALNRGWWLENGSHSASNNNTYTGQDGDGTQRFNSFFSYDLSGLTGAQVRTAKLRLELEAYFGPDASEAVSLFDVSTPANVLEASGSERPDIFQDLQSGNSYATVNFTRGQVGTVVEITLNSQAVA